ncbi:hypothetical protein AF67_00570 [Streptococcus uberis 6780]|nr:hypothetical protein AF64_06745 [Streptococcus uberis C9359]KKF44445.1 hypothetical protein AF61_09450 [Streptococcus uberis EF20/0145]KKF48543.1 hypothetical protein AF59_09625 [Streptococcus uberis C5072]KKF53478.1 hypothetical protein AF65_06815 [Streptococcus uberis C5388]KKF55621.1 hypothetical protein AF67_00570 [Streptococcus uberis 6780]KKF60456.1 hypothetical protein AF68_07060 [Streptococcus uberis B362]KKF61657.1 hypothetical protein AF58_09460 [Streptococcus uberis C6344]
MKSNRKTKSTNKKSKLFKKSLDFLVNVFLRFKSFTF